jgi:hypothetical protein
MVMCGVLRCAAAASAAAQFSPWGTFPLQYADARVLPAGVLRASFLPSYANYAQRFADDGAAEPLGSGLTTDSLGSNLLTVLAAGERELRAGLGDSSYRMTLGPLATRLDADVRRIPLDLALGLTSRITLTAHVSLVKTRMQASVTLDSSQANVGWNQVAARANNPAGAAQIATLLAQLASAVQALSNQIANGGFGCPGSPSCAQAMATHQRALELLGSLRILTTGAVGSPMTPVVPLSSAPAGIALRGEVTAVLADLESLGLGPFSGSLVLPVKTLSAADFQALLADSAFGYRLRPIATTDISRLGDTELGLRVGLVRGPVARVVLNGGVRLPTATRDSLDHAVDLGTGDKQLDIEAGLEVAVESGALGLAAQAVFTRQLADNLTLRSPAAGALVPVTASGPFRRDLGDVLQLAAYPSLRLSQAINLFVLAYHYRKSGDTYDFLGSPTADVPARTVTPVASALNLGGGIHYRAERTGSGEARLPVEAGLSYQAAYGGTGGAPKSTMLNLYLRLYYRIY